MRRLGSLIAFLLLAGSFTLGVHAASWAASANKVSQALTRDAAAKLADQDAMGALSLYESAVVADPRNTAAYVGLGRAYDALQRPVDSMRYYGLALTLDPNDLNALEAQSMAFIAAGDIAQAQDNLNRLRRICVSGCAALNRVDAAIGRALNESGSAPAEEAKGTGSDSAAKKG